MKTKQTKAYSISGDRQYLDKQAKKAHKAFRQARKAARGSVWKLAREA